MTEVTMRFGYGRNIWSKIRSISNFDSAPKGENHRFSENDTQEMVIFLVHRLGLVHMRRLFGLKMAIFRPNSITSRQLWSNFEIFRKIENFSFSKKIFRNSKISKKRSSIAKILSAEGRFLRSSIAENFCARRALSSELRSQLEEVRPQRGLKPS